MAEKTFEEEDFDFEGKREETTFLVHMIAGSCAGLMEHVAMYPLDTIKTHMQTSTKKTTFFNTLNTIYTHGGFSRFWKGSMIIGTASVPAHSLYFSVYEVCKKKFGVNNTGFQFLASAMTGAVATLFHDLILTPADMIKQRIQLTGSSKCFECAKNIFKTEGLFSFYRSLPITLLMNAPYAVTTVMVNENIKKVVEPKKRKFKFLSYFFCAAIAGSVASFITCPMDNIKTKLQTQNLTSSCEKFESINKEASNLGIKNFTDNKNSFQGAKPAFSSSFRPECVPDKDVKYRSILSTVQHIYRQDGFLRGFFKGLTPRIINNSPSCAISWGTYEIIKHLISGNKE